MQNNDKSIKDITDKNALFEYLSIKAKNHRKYKMYHTMERIESIIEDECFYLSDGENWNDVTDKNNFNSDKDYKYFGICFSYSISENVAMWMLYGGLHNNGGMLEFSQSNIKEILKSKEVLLGYFENNKFIIKKTLHDNFDIDIVDILYFGNGDDEHSYYVRRSSEVVKNFPKDIVDKLGFCKKALPWQYENETRIVVKIKKDLLSSDICFCKINLTDSICKDISKKVFHAPNYKGELKYNKSKLSGQINWKLCDGRCQKS